MQDNTTKATTENEVHLREVTGRLSGFFSSILDGIFGFYQTLIRNKWTTLFLIGLGVALGIVLHLIAKPSYKNVMVVSTNYNSNEYFYNTIKNYRSLVVNAANRKDSLLLSKISGIKAEPIPNAYELLLSNYQNLQAFKVLSDRGIDLEKYLKSKVAEKNYRYHKLTFVTNVPKDSTELVIDHFFKTINATTYFNERKKFEKANIQIKRQQLQQSVDQLNAIFENMGNSSNAHVALNDYSNMEDLLMSKEYLLNQINMLDVENLENDEVIYNVFKNINLNNQFPIPTYLYLPIVFLILYGISIKIKNRYIAYTNRTKE